MSYNLNNTIPLLNYLKEDSFIQNIDEKKIPLGYKTDDNLILYYNNEDLLKDVTEYDKSLFNSTKSVLINKDTMRPIYTQYNNMIMNKEVYLQGDVLMLVNQNGFLIYHIMICLWIQLILNLA